MDPVPPPPYDVAADASYFPPEVMIKQPVGYFEEGETSGVVSSVTAGDSD